jgi:hypothetical protein
MSDVGYGMRVTDSRSAEVRVRAQLTPGLGSIDNVRVWA